MVNILTAVPENKRFKFYNGRTASNVKELYNEIKTLPEKSFLRHVNQTRNDFYYWIRSCYRDQKLADDLLECSSKEAALYCLKSSVDEAENVEALKDLPKKNILDNANENLKILKELPRKNVLDNEKALALRKANKTGLFAGGMIKKSDLKKKKTSKTTKFSVKEPKEKLNKAQLRLIKSESADKLIQKLKEVYKLE